MVLGRYTIAATDASLSSVARSKLLALATTVHDAFVTAGICEAGYHIQVSLNPQLPLRLSVQLQTIDPKTLKPTNLKTKGIPVILDLSDPPGGTNSYLECIRMESAHQWGGPLAPIPNPADVRAAYERRLTHVQFDAPFGASYLSEGGGYYATDDHGHLEIPLTGFASLGIVPNRDLTPTPGEYQLNLSLFAEGLYGNLAAGDRKGLAVMATVYAAPTLAVPGASPSAPPWDFKDFTASSGPQEIRVDHVAEIVSDKKTITTGASGANVGQQVLAQVLHPYLGPYPPPPGWRAPDWVNVPDPMDGKAPFPLLPLDQVSLVQNETVQIEWLTGSIFSFTTNNQALSSTSNRVVFWISPTQPTDVLDHANFPGTTLRSLLSVTKSYDPVVAAGGKWIGDKGQWLIVKLITTAASATKDYAGKVVGFAAGALNTWVESASPPGVIISRIQSTVAYHMGDQPEAYLVEGNLQLLDPNDPFGLTATQSLSPGQVLRYQTGWQSPSVSSFSQGDLPQTVQADIKQLSGTGATGTSGTDAGASPGGTATSGGNGSSAGAGSQSTAPQNSSGQRNDAVVGSSLGWRFYLPIGVGAGCIVVALIVTLALAASRRRNAAVAVPVGPQPPFPVPAPVVPQPPYAMPAPLAPRPPHAQPSPSMAAGWFISHGQDSLGPYTWTQLIGFARIGAVEPGDLVWRPQGSEWVRAADLPGLFADPQPPPPPPPPPR